MAGSHHVDDAIPPKRAPRRSPARRERRTMAERVGVFSDDPAKSHKENG
jgi:hypothetical protein